MEFLIEEIDSFEKMSEFLRKSVQDKSVFKWKNPEQFNIVYSRTLELCQSGDELRVLALLGRLEAGVKKPVFSVEKLESLMPEGPDIQSLVNGDDRYYAALEVERISPEWSYAWALKHVWQEPASEKARKVLCGILINLAPSFEQLLFDLGREGCNYSKSNKLGEAKIANRLQRLIKALRLALHGKNLNCQPELGKFVDKLVGLPFSHFVVSNSIVNARVVAISEIFSLLTDLIGHRFSLALETDTYRVLPRLQGWCDFEKWRSITKRDPGMERLRNTLSEAVLILARQNITDGQLLSNLKTACRDEQQFSSICLEMLDSGHLNSEVADWLRNGGKVPLEKSTLRSEGELSERASEELVGRLLLQLQEGGQSVKKTQDVIDDLELFDPGLVPVISSITNHWFRLGEIAQSLADQFSVRLVGEEGDLVDIDRIIFEVANSGEQSARHGEVIRPAIVSDSSSTMRVIQKGVVKKVGSHR